MALMIGGVVESVNVGEATERYPQPATFVRVDGLSCLLSRGVEVPVVGDVITGTCSVHHKDKRQTVFLLRWALDGDSESEGG